MEDQVRYKTLFNKTINVRFFSCLGENLQIDFIKMTKSRLLLTILLLCAVVSQAYCYAVPVRQRKFGKKFLIRTFYLMLNLALL